MLEKIVGPHLAPKIPWLGLFASALAFSFILSLVPFLVLTVALAERYLPLDISSPIIALLKNILPPDAQLDIESVVQAAGRIAKPGTLTLGFAAAAWTCLNFMYLFAQALHFIFADPEIHLQTTWRTWLRSVGMLTIWMTCLVATCFLLLYSQTIRDALLRTGQWPSFALLGIKIVASLLVLFLINSALFWTYRLTPYHPPERKRTHAAALFTAVGWLATCALFAWILPTVWKTNILYGALGSIVALLIWAYVCAWIVLLGACAIARR
jgi:membrane protein